MSTNKIQDLKKQLSHVNLLLDEAKRKEKNAVLAVIKEQVKEYSITELELLRAAGFIKAPPKRLPAKYYDASTGNSWSGHGACPKWLVGKNRDDYLIRDEPKPWWPEKD